MSCPCSLASSSACPCSSSSFSSPSALCSCSSSSFSWGCSAVSGSSGCSASSGSSPETYYMPRAITSIILEPSSRRFGCRVHALGLQGLVVQDWTYAAWGCRVWGVFKCKEDHHRHRLLHLDLCHWRFLGALALRVWGFMV